MSNGNTLYFAASTKPRKATTEYIISEVTVTGLETSVSAYIDKPRGQGHERVSFPWLKVKGDLREAIRGTKRIEISVAIDDEWTASKVGPDRIGSILQVRPYVSAYIELPTASVSRVWDMAVNGFLKFANLTACSLRYGSAAIINVSFSNVREDEEDQAPIA